MIFYGCFSSGSCGNFDFFWIFEIMVQFYKFFSKFTKNCQETLRKFCQVCFQNSNKIHPIPHLPNSVTKKSFQFFIRNSNIDHKKRTMYTPQILKLMHKKIFHEKSSHKYFINKWLSFLIPKWFFQLFIPIQTFQLKAIYFPKIRKYI